MTSEEKVVVLRAALKSISDFSGSRIIQQTVKVALESTATIPGLTVRVETVAARLGLSATAEPSAPDGYACKHAIPWAHRCLQCEEEKDARRAELLAAMRRAYDAGYSRGLNHMTRELDLAALLEES